jgi:hypothetical protein
MKARDKGCTQETAAAKADISVRSGRRIEKGEHRPHRGRPHNWRTRADPLQEVWDQELVPMLTREPQLQAMTLLEYLQQQYPGRYGASVERTLQRRVQQWKAIQGPAQEVMFPQRHEPGMMGLSDFTHLKKVQVTIAGQPYEHLLYHYRLAYSGWQYVQVIEGGESFVGLAEGLQNALQACGGAPREHRSDSLSAAYRNRQEQTATDLTEEYAGLCQHYRMQPSRNNRGVAHENGAIESSHGHFKRRLQQALLLRGSVEFESAAAYQTFVAQVVEQANQRCCERFSLEQSHLQPLPTYRYPDYQVLSVKVTCHSTITLRRITYTVPSRLIGQTLTVHLHHDRLVGFVGGQPVVHLGRLRTPKGDKNSRLKSVNYRHVVESLRRKPRAFLSCLWQQDLLPDDNYRQLWQQMRQQFDAATAARLITESLYIAATQDKEHAVATYLQQHLDRHTLTLAGLQQHFHLVHPPSIPTLETQQHALSSYDQLLAACSPRQPQSATEVPEVAPHSPALAGVGTPVPAAGMDPCSIFVGAMRTRSDSTLPGAGRPLPQRSTPTRGQGFFKL